MSANITDLKRDIKNGIKNNSTFKVLQLKKRYRNKYHTNWGEALFKTTVINGNNYKKLLKKVKIHNEGAGDFFYSLDKTVIARSKNNVIDNLPVDYSKAWNTEGLSNDLESALQIYIERAKDPRISLERPQTLKEALQSILFWNQLLWQTGHRLMGLGRLDKLLEPFDIPENAEEIIKDFLITLHSSYDFKSNALLGDTGQIIIVGGLEADGSYFCNRYTLLLIKCIKELKLPDPKLLIRSSSIMPEDLLEKAIDCMSTGIGSPLLSNDDVVIPCIIEFGYSKEDAYNYGVSACWEPLIIGKSLEQNNLTDIEFGKCINECILDSRFLNCNNIDEIIDLFELKLAENIEQVLHMIDEIKWENDPLLSYLMNLEKDISQGGAQYNNYGVLSLGISSAVNSILNIQRFVFAEKKYNLCEIQKIILNNYNQGIEPFDENINGFGTDSTEAILLTNRFMAFAEQQIKYYRNRFGGKLKFGLSSSSYLDKGKMANATLDGRKAGEPFPTHISRDNGAALTELINFSSQLKYTGLSSNANVIDVMVQSALIIDNIDRFVLLLSSGMKEGFFQLQMNVLSYYQLVDAKRHPEKYKGLIVRVWGFSAYFNDLPEEYKNNLINRAKKMESIE